MTATPFFSRAPGRQSMPADVPVPPGCSVIYRPRGRAREYASLACNLYSGCAHGCVYCFGPGTLRKSRADFDQARVRPNILDRLERDAARFARAGITGQVLLCFTCDPYQPLDVETQVTHAAIEILHAHSLSVQVLTKGGARALRDLDLFGPGDAFATTLTLVDEQDSAEWEPGAASPAERIETIQAFHEAGIETWVSLEPVIWPEDSLELIRRTAGFVDLYTVGKMNHHATPEPVDWGQFARDAVALLEELQRPYYLKADLAAYLEDPRG